MISRRVLLGTGAGAVSAAGLLIVADLTHVLDDAADIVGIDPRPESDPADDTLLADAAAAQSILLATVLAVAQRHRGLALEPFAAIGREHVTALGGTPSTQGAPVAPAEVAASIEVLSQAYDSAAAARAVDAVRAGAPELVLVLASMSAGLAQCSRDVRRLA